MRRSDEASTERWRRATPDERLRAAAAQREVSKELLRSGLRLRFPGLSEAEIEHRVGEMIFGAPMWREMCERRRRGPSRH